MARLIEEQNLNRVEKLVAKHPRGVRRPELEAEYAATYSESVVSRTLVRWLNRLAEQGRVNIEGERRGVTYYPPGVIAETEEGYIPLSREGAKLRALIRRPLMERKPVAYESFFLWQYVPGHTWYLSPRLRARLHEMGRTPDESRPAGTYARDIFGRLLIDLAWASSRLEGNTYTRLDTQNLLQFGQRAEGKDASEAQMILNHKAAIELLVNQAEEVGFNLYTFRNLHGLLAENLLSDPAGEGRIRDSIVNITGTVFQPLSVPQQIEEHFREILEKADAIPDPFEQAFFIMVHIPYLQPFIDVNKRVSRLGANLPLIKHNLCPLSFIDVPERAYIDGTLAVYELRRIELLRDVFAWAYERSCMQYKVVRQALGEPDSLRLRYRNQTGEVVGAIVRSGAPPQRSSIREAARGLVAEAEMEAFEEVVLGALVNLHEGNVARYGLRPSEFAAWRAQWGTTPS